MQIETHHLEDDGHVPNNALGLILYRDALTLVRTADDVLARLDGHGWRGGWVNGIYGFHHYHARSHEVLVNLGAAVTVQFGGKQGPIVQFGRGDAVVIPAGVGHCRVSGEAGLVIVGAYPVGQEDWDLKRADQPADYRRALAEIPLVGLPASDPITGMHAPLLEMWKA